ncbi:unnamed protein product [Owenia fusiformis]|uniref:Sulfide:quinone oxidoreductase, mitochondrial n=1 Tax=Owenia fusiformis TaxID=6347 RepID=A0A8S4NFX1_OWEFU|nr:unnamed protein product [Owenia fusiformis]
MASLKNLVKLQSRLCLRDTSKVICSFSTSARDDAKKDYKLVVIGGGTGGFAVTSKFAKKLGKGQIAVVEPNEEHYYQSMFTLVGGGLKTLEQAHRPTGSLLPDGVDWIKDSVAEFDAQNNFIVTQKGDKVRYDFLVIAMGIQLNYEKIKGALDALKHDPMVCSNYRPPFVSKTFEAIKNFKEGNAIFTLPNTPIKCAGAPQKIMYLADYHFRAMGKRHNANIYYRTSLPFMFTVKKYADALFEVAKNRGIDVAFRRCLIEVKHESKEAIFEDLENGNIETLKYAMLHLVPPMSCPDVLTKHKDIVDETGWVDVNKDTLQHKKYPNIFALGDCTNLPTSKTAAAVSSQSRVLQRNLNALLDGKPMKAVYDGYTSCPLITTKGKVIMAEFGFDQEPLETFPINQAKERRFMYHLKKDFMPHLYWKGLVKGHWNGPKYLRRILHLGMSK